MSLPLRHPLLRDGDAPAKQAILKAALRLFIVRSTSGTSIRDIAEEAGFTNPALYKHFASKEVLAERLFEDGYLWISGRTEAALASTSPKDALEVWVRTAVALYEECPEVVLFVNDQVRELWPRMRLRLERHSLVAQTRRVVQQSRREERGAVSVELATASLLGTLAQWARLLYFEALPGKPSRWTHELVVLAQRIVS